MAVIMDYYFNNTRIIVKDDYYCSEEEAEEIIKRVGEKLSRYLCEQEEKTA